MKSSTAKRPFSEVLKQYRFLIVGGAVALVYFCIFLATYDHALRAGVTSEEYVVATGDSSEYVAVARTLLADHRFALSADAMPESFRSPGYPFFVALLLGVFHSILAIPIVQILLASSSVVLVLALGERWFSRGIGFAAAALYAVEPTAIAHTFVALSETLFMFFFLAGTFLALDANTPKRTFWVGVMLGIAALVRPIEIFAIAPFAALIAWRFRKQIRLALLPLLALFLGTALVVSPWMARNEIVGGRFTISTIGAYNPLFYNIVTFEASRRHISETIVREEILHGLGISDLSLLRSAQLSAPERALTWKYLSAHPLQYGMFHLLKTIPFFLGSGFQSDLALVHAGIAEQDINISGLILNGHMTQALISLAAAPEVFLESFFWLLISAFSVLSIFAWRYDRERFPVVLVFLSLIGGFAILTGPISMPRYRLPAEPFMFLLASMTATMLWYRLRGRFQKHKRDSREMAKS